MYSSAYRGKQSERKDQMIWVAHSCGEKMVRKARKAPDIESSSHYQSILDNKGAASCATLSPESENERA